MSDGLLWSLVDRQRPRKRAPSKQPVSPSRQPKDERAWDAIKRATAAVLLGLVVFLVISSVILKAVEPGYDEPTTTLAAILGALLLAEGLREARDSAK